MAWDDALLSIDDFVDSVTSTVTNVTDGLLEQIIVKAGEIIVAGVVISASNTEYILDSLAQSLDPITDPFMIAIRPGMSNPGQHHGGANAHSAADEAPSLVGFQGYLHEFWQLGNTEFAGSRVTFTKYGAYTESSKTVSFVHNAGSYESSSSVSFTNYVYVGV